MERDWFLSLLSSYSVKNDFFLTVCAGMGGKSDCRENKFSGLPFGQSH